MSQSDSSSAPTRRSTRLNAIHQDRIAMIKGNFQLPEDVSKHMGTARKIVSECTTHVQDLIDDNPNLQYNEGRLTAFFDLLQQAKDVLCGAFILPYGPSSSSQKATK